MADDKCGTYAGWNEHHREGSPACKRCKRAQASYMRKFRTRGRCAPGLGWPLEARRA